MRGGGHTSFLLAQGFTEICHPIVVSGYEDTEVVETDEDRFRTEFGITTDPCHPELVSESSLALHYSPLPFPFPLADLRTDGVSESEQIRIASRLSRQEHAPQAKFWERGANPRQERVRVRGKFGFTLAEVLITLSIIGIVAAMTLPSLTNKYQHKVLESQFKKSYANLQTAINTVNSENGIPYECYTLKYGGNYYYTQCNEFWPKVLEQYKTAKECGNWRKPQCRSKYKSKAEVIAAGGFINNTACSFAIDSYTAYNLNDGSIIYLFKNASGYNSHNGLFFGIDVNGKKGPNKWGYDLFYLNLYKRNQKAPVLGLTAVCELLEKGGISAEEMMLK